jgi:hypothetical protein
VHGGDSVLYRSVEQSVITRMHGVSDLSYFSNPFVEEGEGGFVLHLNPLFSKRELLLYLSMISLFSHSKACSELCRMGNEESLFINLPSLKVLLRSLP